VQPFLQKCFDGIAALEFTPSLDIVACMDPSGEKVPFPYADVKHKVINPNDFGGNVEKWLVEVEVSLAQLYSSYGMCNCECAIRQLLPVRRMRAL
jgi:dynein heavy chain, axonemal